MLKDYVTGARMCITGARMSIYVNGRDEQEGNLARYSNLRIYKLHVINCNFIDDYCDTAVEQYL